LVPWVIYLLTSRVFADVNRTITWWVTEKKDTCAYENVAKLYKPIHNDENAPDFISSNIIPSSPAISSIRQVFSLFYLVISICALSFSLSVFYLPPFLLCFLLSFASLSLSLSLLLSLSIKLRLSMCVRD